MEQMIGNYEGFKKETDMAVEKIRTGAKIMAQGAVELGYQLKIARDTGILQESGYTSMSEFAKEEYGIRPDQTSRYIQINDKYSENGYSRTIKGQYEGFGVSLLADMLQLPDMVMDEITQKFSREDIRNLTSEINEENKVTDLEVMMEEEDTAQTELPSILEKTVYQLGKDMPELYTELFEAIYEQNSESMIDALVPDEEKIYSLRIPGTGRMLLSLKTAEEEIKLINVRSQEKESCTWQQLEEAFRKIMHFENGPEESWEKQFEDTFPHAESTEPKPEKAEKKKPKVEKAKKPEKKQEKNESKGQKTARTEETAPALKNFQADSHSEPPKPEPEKEEKCQETAPEPQIPGQDSIENHPEYMPQPEKTEPEEETVSKNIDTDTESVPEEPEIAPAQTESDILEKPITRKEYIDSLTVYGTAEYLAKTMLSFRSKTYNTLLEQDFWEEWLNRKVDHNGRPWID